MDTITLMGNETLVFKSIIQERWIMLFIKTVISIWNGPKKKYLKNDIYMDIDDCINDTNE